MVPFLLFLTGFEKMKRKEVLWRTLQINKMANIPRDHAREGELFGVVDEVEGTALEGEGGGDVLILHRGVHLYRYIYV